MNGSERPNDFDERTRRQLARLADGSLRGPERARLEARVAESVALRAALERQRTGISALRALDLAPSAGLRARIAAERSSRRRPARRRGWTVAGALAGAAATAALLVTLLLPSTGDPNVVEASRLSLRPATASVAVDYSNPKLLAASVEGVPFPNWRHEFGWREAGTRTDRLESRESRTVFYERGGRRIGYTILSGAGVRAPSGYRTTEIDGVAFHSGRDGGRPVVTWWRDGRTCVLSGVGVGERELVRLASWKGDGAVPF
jgi:hypothetical protein